MKKLFSITPPTNYLWNTRANKFKDQLTQNLKNFMYFSLALDESCNVSDIAQ